MVHTRAPMQCLCVSLFVKVVTSQHGVDGYSPATSRFEKMSYNQLTDLATGHGKLFKQSVDACVENLDGDLRLTV